jgi:hypothetical protein
MKKLLIAAFAAACFGLSATQTNACEYAVSSCAPHRVSICVVCRNTYCKTAYDRCGNAYHYSVTVVTFRDLYSDGSSQTYTRSFRS